MAERRNFLLGKGERLTEPVSPARRAVIKVAPYTPEEARDRLAPMVREAVSRMARLPERARRRKTGPQSRVSFQELLSSKFSQDLRPPGCRK